MDGPTLSELCSGDFPVAGPGTPLASVADLLARHPVLVVVTDDRPAGVLTAAMLLTPPPAGNESVGQRMAPAPLIDARTDLHAGYRRLCETALRVLVLVDDTGGLVGVITERDLLAHFASLTTPPTPATSLESADISLRKALNAVRHSDRVLDSVFSALPDLFFCTRRDGTIIDYRARQQDDLYAPPDYFLGKRMQDILPEAVARQFVSRLTQAIDTGQIVSFDYALDISSQIRRYEARICPLADHDQIIAVVRDITDSYATSQALRESEAQLSFALDAAEGGVWDWDLASDTWQASARFFSQLGYAPDDRPQHLDDWLPRIHPDDRALFIRHMDAQRTVGAPPFDIEIRMQHADGGEHWIRRKGKTVAWDANARPARVVGTHTDITAHKADELALQALNRKLESAQSMAHVGWWEWSPVTGDTVCSAELMRLHGLTPDAPVPRLESWVNHVVSEDREAVRQALDTALSTGLLECEFSIHRYDTGERRDFKTRGYVSFDANRKPTRLFGVTADVTELRDLGRRYAQAARIGESAAWEIWPNEGRLQVDTNLTWLTGDTPDTLPASLSDWLGRLPEDDAEAFLAALTAVARGDTDTLKLDHRIQRRDGSTGWLHAQGQRISGPDETPVCVLGSWVDITEHKHAEKQLRDSESRFRALTTLAPVGIYHTDAAGGLRYANPRWCAIAGLDNAQAQGEGWVAALHPDDRDRVVAQWRDAVTHGAAFEAEFRYRRSNGEIVWVDGAANPLIDASGAVSGYLGVSFDITERIEADNARRDHIHLLESLEKIDAALRDSRSVDEAITLGTAAIRDMLDCDGCWLAVPCDPSADHWSMPAESVRAGHPSGSAPAKRTAMTPSVATLWRAALASADPCIITGNDGALLNDSLDARSLMLTALRPSTGPAWALGARQSSHARHWRPTEQRLFAEAARRLVGAIERHNLVEQLRTSEHRYRSVVEDLPVLLCRHRPDGIIEFVNQAYCDYFGKPPSALIGHNLLALIPPEQHDEISARLGALNADTPVLTHEHEVLDAKGQIRWQRWTNRAICNAQGDVVMLQAFGEDITERKRAEQALIRQQHELAEAQQQAHLGSFVWNISSDEIRWSDELFRLFGLDPLAQPPSYPLFLDAVHPDDVARVDAAFKAALKSAIPFREEFRLKRPDGRHCWLFANGRIETEQGGRAVFMRGTLLDITERVHATEALQRAHDELEQRVEQRTAELKATNAELEAFTYAASHDLRAPLRAIQGFQRALEEDFGDALPDGARDFLAEIATASVRMGELIDGLLELSRSSRASLVRQRLDLGELAESIHARLARNQPDRHVTLHCDGDLNARGDSRLLATVMQNLIENAWKYSRDRTHATIDVTASMRNGQKVYCVEDNGAGFDQTFANKLFEPFQRLHHPSEFPGIGIGLATVARIVRRHGGWIEGEGRPGEGARFRFSLGTQEGDAA